MALIAEAQTQLDAIKRNQHKEVIAKIKELAASIGVTVDIRETIQYSMSKGHGIAFLPLEGSQTDQPVPIFCAGILKSKLKYWECRVKWDNF